MAPGKSTPPAGNSAPAASPEWRPGQDWSPGAGGQQDQQIPWWLAPSQPSQPGFNQQGFNQQGFNQQGFNQQGFNQGYGPQATGPQPTGPQGTGPFGPTGASSPPPSGGGRPSRLPLIAVTIAAAALLGAGAGAYVLIDHPFSSPTGTTAQGSSVANVSQSTPASPSATPSSGTGPATTPAQTSPAAPTTPPATPPATHAATQNTSERQAATTLAGLLSQSSSDRSAINDAYNDAYSCGGSLSGDQQTFEQAASNRQYLLNQLGSLPDAQTLPTQMLTDLTNAWQASLSVDNDYAQWAGDENSSGCTLQDPSYAAAETPNEEATTDKNAFVSQWNTIAARYSLPQYSGNGI
jgi:hypothetical protein